MCRCHRFKPNTFATACLCALVKLHYTVNPCLPRSIIHRVATPAVSQRCWDVTCKWGGCLKHLWIQNINVGPVAYLSLSPSSDTLHSDGMKLSWFIIDSTFFILHTVQHHTHIYVRVWGFQYVMTQLWQYSNTRISVFSYLCSNLCFCFLFSRTATLILLAWPAHLVSSLCLQRFCVNSL